VQYCCFCDNIPIFAVVNTVIPYAAVMMPPTSLSGSTLGLPQCLLDISKSLQHAKMRKHDHLRHSPPWLPDRLCAYF